MSEYYDHYHRWEPLAEFHFNLDSDDEDCDEENYLYCLCSRAFLRDGVKYYYVDKEEGSESDMEVQKEWDDQSHVHFSLDTSYKVKCERDEGASCYGSASHTENCCSTDEHEVGHIHGISHALQPSDSGADLTYQDCHSDYTAEKLERMDQDFTQDKDENYLTEDTWDKFWAINGERLIWASWIKKYSDYINPSYLDDNNDLVMDENNIPKQKSVDQIYKEEKIQDEEMRERKFSYDSKVNPYKKGQNFNRSNEKPDKVDNKDESWLPIARRRSCSEHERIVSPRTLAATDSMTNVTKITMSSYDVSSSHVTSESTPTDDYSVSSSTSDDPSNDQTRIANIETLDLPIEEMDTEQYWQFLWKKHFGDQYAIHYANYVESHNIKDQDLPTINIENTQDNDVFITKIDLKEDKPFDVDYENSEGNSQEMPTVIEVQAQVEEISLEDQNKTDIKKVIHAQQNANVTKHIQVTQEITIEDENIQETHKNNKSNEQNIQDITLTQTIEETPYKTVDKPQKRSKRQTSRYLDSVGLLLQNLLKEEQIKGNTVTEIDISNNEDYTNEVLEAGDDNTDKKNKEETAESSVISNTNIQQSVSNNNLTSYSYDDGDDDPPEDTPISLKRSHEIDDEDTVAEKIKSTFEIMGFCMRDNKMPKGAMVYRKRLARLRPPRSRKFGAARKTYFDEEGNPVQDHEREEEKKEMQTDDNDPDPQTLEQSETERLTDTQTHTVITDTQTHTDITDTQTHTDITENTQTDITEHTQTVQDPSDTVTYTVENKTENCVEDDKAQEAADCPLPSDFEQSSDNLDVEKSSENTAQNPDLTKRRRRQKKKKGDTSDTVTTLPAELQDDPKMMKYWKKRHSLFHRFDEGIKLDRESWFSVTPESVARHIARKYTYDTVLDAFCGAGGNTIQFARTSHKVIAIDIDPVKIEMAKHNAQVYGVAERIQFVVGDFFELAPTLQADMVFLSPPWGGPNYSNNVQYDIETMLEPRPASELMDVARAISPNISLYLPRNSKPDQILSLAKEVGGSVEVEQSYLDKRFVAITAYFY